MTAISEASVEKIDSFDPQNLANTARAYATAALKDAGLLTAISKAAVEKIRESRG